ncbi:MAG: carbon-nitrogen hydrolase family protein [Anaerolineae bacterium]|nr:carbon-nitrogen hydrolase family protein [Anaerolineae bacterium]
MIDEAARRNADLILFPEAAVTGLINNDNPAHDLPLGQEIPGAITDQIALHSRSKDIWTAIGLLERDRNELYDTAVLIAPDGEVKLKYRRIQPQWHGRNADPLVYRQGTEMAKVDTPLGTFAFLICGDLFDDEIIERARDLQPDWILFPFARCFADGSYDQGRWDREEQAEYLRHVRLIGVTTLMTNYLAERDLLGGAFGGAMIVAGYGTIQASLSLGRRGVLIVEQKRKELDQ